MKIDKNLFINKNNTIAIIYIGQGTIFKEHFAKQFFKS